MSYITPAQQKRVNAECVLACTRYRRMAQIRKMTKAALVKRAEKRALTACE